MRTRANRHHFPCLVVHILRMFINTFPLSSISTILYKGYYSYIVYLTNKNDI